jgi:GntR family transcriptional regulator / MocR family aminotransferase
MLTYSFAERGQLSLYEHLYRCIRDDIEQGRIAAGEKMPSKRSFAKHLGVSLITVEGAYAQLVAEGYLRSEPRRGFYACEVACPSAGSSRHASGKVSGSARTADDAKGSTAHDAAQPNALRSGEASTSNSSFDASEAAEAIETLRSSGIFADFTGASDQSDAFPYGSWAKSVRETLICEPEEALVGQVPAAGTSRLRKAIAGHLRSFRGMDVDQECIVVGAGSQVLYNLIVQLLGRDLRFGVEDPGYARLRQIYRANDVSLSALPLEEQGICLAAAYEANVNVLHLMPSHQYPTGIVTSVGRRYELLAWAAEQDSRFIIEDDYDCEFRLAGRPIPSLQSVDALGKVIYVNTFTKSLGPAFRIGYMVLPPELAQRFRDKLGFYSCTVSAIDQLALARFIESGEFERHVNRARTRYRGVRDALIAQLQQSSLRDRMVISGQDAGIHFLLGIKLPSCASVAEWERAFVRSAGQRGVALRAVSSFYANGDLRAAGWGSSASSAATGVAKEDAQSVMPQFVISYGGVSEDALPAAVGVLEKAVEAADNACSAL